MTEAGTPARSVLARSTAAERLAASAAALVSSEEPEGAGERLLLAASTRAGRELLRGLAAERGDVFGVHCLTLAQLANELAGPALAGRGAAPLAALAAEAVAARALARCCEEAPLAFFGGVCASPGFLRALVGTLAELRLHRLAPAALAPLGDRGADLARLLAAYEEELAGWALADSAEVYALATAAAAAGGHRYHRLPLVLLDVPLRNPAEAALVAALAAAAPRALATVPAGDEESAARLAEALGVAGGARSAPAPEGVAAGVAAAAGGGPAAGAPATGTEAAATAASRRLDRVREALFAEDPAAAVASPGDDDSVAVFSAPGEGAEAVEIARRALRLAEAGVPFDRLAVLLRDPDTYQPLVEEAFGRAGVPVWCSRGVLRPEPAGRAFLALLDCAAEDLSARRFAEYLSLGQVPRTDSGGAPPERPVPWVEADPEERPGARGELAELEGMPVETAGAMVGGGDEPRPYAGMPVETGRTAVAGGDAPGGEATVPAARAAEAAGAATEPTPAVGEATGATEEAAAQAGPAGPETAKAVAAAAGVASATVGAAPATAASPAAPAEDDPDDPDSPVLAGTLRAPLQWERLLVEAAVVGGRDRWARRLSGLEQELLLQRAGAEDEAAAERLDRQLEKLRSLERFALPLVDALAALPRAARWGDWLPRLEALASRALAMPERVLRVLAELRPMADVGPLGLAEVRAVLARRLSFLRESPRERPYGRVFVGAVDEARGRSFHTVFLPGLGDGIFPRRPHEDPLLLDGDRAALGAGLPEQDTRVARERLLLRLAAGSAEERLVVSWSTLDTLQGRPRVPSFYALDVVRAADGALPRQRELARRAAAACALLPGWPAPERPADAVDAAEHDLAVLRPLLALPAQETRGRGRFLLELNPHLARALRSRYARWRRGGFGRADGLVDPDAEAAAHLHGFRLAARPWSVTTLQAWAACPYRFLLHGIHRLRPRDEVMPLERLDPATRGQLFHRVQAEAQRELAGRGLLPFRRDDREALLDCVERHLQRIAAEQAEELAPALPRVWEQEVDELRTDLRGWVQAVLDDAEPWVPGWFELAFGLDERGPDRPSRDERSAAAPVELPIAGGVRLRGSIDLVERSPDGGQLRVTDHKTGRAMDTRRLAVGQGEVLQPLLYALAAEALLGVPARGGRLFWCTRRGGYQALEAPLDPFKRHDLEETLQGIDGAVRDGFFPAAPREGACRWCDYALACGPDEELRLRRRRRDDPRLQPLLAAREKE